MKTHLITTLKIHLVFACLSLQCLSAKPGVVTNNTTGKEYAQLQKALDDAVASQTLIVGDGTWKENVVVQNGVVLKSENGPAKCIIDGGGERIISWTGTGGRIEGFTLTHGAGSGNGGVLHVEAEKAPDLIGNIVSGNNTDGSLIFDCPGLIAGNIFRDNTASALVLNRHPGETVFENNLITGNTIVSSDIIGQLLVIHSQMLMRNTTIVANILPPDGGVAYFQEGIIYNSIFWNNGGPGFHRAPAVIQNCFVEATVLNDPPMEAFELDAPPRHVKNFMKDPQLNPEGVPLAGSPVLHAGNRKNAPATDILGVRRGLNEVSIGAYENP